MPDVKEYDLPGIKIYTLRLFPDERGFFSEALRSDWKELLGEDEVAQVNVSFSVVRKGEQSPYIHNLRRLAEVADIQVTEGQKAHLIRITAFHLESRYPDEKRSFRKKCNEDFTRRELKQIEEVFQWLKSMLQ